MQDKRSCFSSPRWERLRVKVAVSVFSYRFDGVWRILAYYANRKSKYKPGLENLKSNPIRCIKNRTGIMLEKIEYLNPIR
ncbi:hypothetical protein YC2023_019245 [Brassica napus]